MINGSEEKFRVYNRDDPVDPLHSRIAKLPFSTSGFNPEILSIFFSLSDRPLQNLEISDLGLLVKPDSLKELTWENIIADHPMGGEIWKHIDFGAKSSDE